MGPEGRTKAFISSQTNRGPTDKGWGTGGGLGVRRGARELWAEPASARFGSRWGGRGLRVGSRGLASLQTFRLYLGPVRATWTWGTGQEGCLKAEAEEGLGQGGWGSAAVAGALAGHPLTGCLANGPGSHRVPGQVWDGCGEGAILSPGPEPPVCLHGLGVGGSRATHEKCLLPIAWCPECPLCP